MATREMPSGDELRKTFPSNSETHKDSQRDAEKSDKKDIRQVTTAKVRKKGLLKRFGKSIIEDGIETAKERAFNEIVVPGVKSLLFDTVTDILDSMLFGGTEGGHRSSQRRSETRRRNDRTSYSDYYDRRSNNGHRAYENEGRSYEPDDVILNTRADAREVLEELDFIIRKYGQASVADLYDLVGITGVWTDNQYGWTSLRSATIRPIRDGFMRIMPRTHLLDD